MKQRPQDKFQFVLDEIKATNSGAFFRHETHRGVIRIEGSDTLDLLNRLTTMQVETLGVGGVRETLFVNEKGRLLDAVLVIPVEAGLVRLLTSSPDTSALIAWLERYTIMEDCVYQDESPSFAYMSVYNSPDDFLLGGLPRLEKGKAALASIDGTDVLLLSHESVTGAATGILCDSASAEVVKQQLVRDHNLPSIGDHAWTLWRIDHLLPAIEHELTENANPLEAGATASVDFEKGCYIGQEVIARLDSYQKIQRRPMRMVWQEAAPEQVAAGSALLVDGKNAGFITTHAFDPRRQRHYGIGLIRMAYAEEGRELVLEQDGIQYRLTVHEGP